MAIVLHGQTRKTKLLLQKYIDWSDSLKRESILFDYKNDETEAKEHVGNILKVVPDYFDLLDKAHMSLKVKVLRRKFDALKKEMHAIFPRNGEWITYGK